MFGALKQHLTQLGWRTKLLNGSPALVHRHLKCIQQLIRCNCRVLQQDPREKKALKRNTGFGDRA